MTTYVQSGVVVVFLIGVGWLFILRSKSDQKGNMNSRLSRWIGYSLIVMALFLIVVGVLQYFAWESHGRGH
ncbi:hypothetical protein GC093_26010 [Paenibacillus sp. LMG 31456]|uniref:Uncharacterized protein n=1 Tax=Paenibacillus foliorum TaxID=2654974 RepID=A0A972GYR7_9BACL|nr:hypothetical protein [Paenibacillus foliorum]NOU96648.1 hypothetical protein [Paenibacillus foliorum]